MEQNWGQDYGATHNARAKDLLGAGWRPLARQVDPEYLWHLASRDTWELARKTLDVTSDVADALGRSHYSWFANLLNVFSESTQYEVDEYWNYITPEPPSPDYRYSEILSAQSPVTQMVSRDGIPIDYLLNRLREITVQRILTVLGKPDLVQQLYQDRYFYYPVERFSSFERLTVLGTLQAYWQEQQIWLEVYPAEERGKRNFNLIAQELAPLVNKATYDLAVLLSGYQSRIGQISSPYPINTFPLEVQRFTDTVQQAILDQSQLAVLIHGAPGTGKTAWTQAVAKEILMPLGYVIFILDHDAVEHFVPPTYLERICLIINEADNLAQDRATETAQRSTKTEHILSLLDGTLHQSIADESGLQMRQRLVVLMTCNTTERLDPAMLRKGRVDLQWEFIHCFV